MNAIETERAVPSPFDEAKSAKRSREPTKGIRIAGWIATWLLAAMMTFSGVLFVLGVKPVAQMLHHLGYPTYFGPLLGVAKLLGVAALVAPRAGTLREWAYAGFTFVFVAAVFSHGLSGDGPARAAPAALNLGLLLASYFLRRRAAGAGSSPEERRS